MRKEIWRHWSEDRIVTYSELDLQPARCHTLLPSGLLTSVEHQEPVWNERVRRPACLSPTGQTAVWLETTFFPIGTHASQRVDTVGAWKAFSLITPTPSVPPWKYFRSILLMGTVWSSVGKYCILHKNKHFLAIRSRSCAKCKAWRIPEEAVSHGWITEDNPSTLFHFVFC